MGIGRKREDYDKDPNGAPQLKVDPMSYEGQTDDNLANLPELTEDSLLNALKSRFAQDTIFTYVGDIVIAVNPFRFLPCCIDDNWVNLYQNFGSHNKTKDQAPPHVWMLAYQGYEAMNRTKENQVFVISGESGAGKSETTKLIVRMLISLCKGGDPKLEAKIMAVNPMLEAFGNAKTVMNNNSSRFGKLIKMQFDQSSGNVLGATLSQYLLEKSRVIQRELNERNYHIFYWLFSGLGNKLKDLGLNRKPALEYQYLKSKDPANDETKPEWIMHEDNVSEYKEVVSTFELLGFDSQDVAGMYNILASCLHMGDVTFEDGGNDDSKITSDGAITAKIASLLSQDDAKLIECLTTSSTETRGEVIRKLLTKDQANDNRDAMAKMIYGRMFIWLFIACNKFLVDMDKINGTTVMSLGILDIFGFENFKWNSLEQMCINTTNEQLQYYFNNFIFAHELEEYAKEGVPVENIKYEDNKVTLDMFIAKKESIMVMLDEQVKAPKSDDGQFTKAVCDKFKGRKDFKPPKFERDLHFVCVHYAGEVKYDTLGWLDKNRDTVSRDVGMFCSESGDKLLSALFTDPAITGETGGGKSRKKTHSVFCVSQKFEGYGRCPRSSAAQLCPLPETQ